MGHYQVLPLRVRVNLGAMTIKENSAKLQHYWNLTIRVFGVISKTPIGGGLTSLPRCIQCILHPKTTRPQDTCWRSLFLCSDAVGVFYSPSRLGRRTLTGEVLLFCRDAVCVFYSHPLSQLGQVGRKKPDLWFLPKYSGMMVRVFANGPGDQGSILGWIISKTQKMVLDASLLNTKQYKVGIKGKVEQSRERSCTLPSTKVANFTYFIWFKVILSNPIQIILPL